MSEGRECGSGEVTRLLADTSQHGPYLHDVFGKDDFKTELEDIVLSMKNNMLYHVMGAKPPQSFLFYGPPGTGKTYSVNAIVNELKEEVAPKHVLFMPYDIGKYGTAYINMGSKNMQTFFDAGLEQLINNPEIHSVVRWFDEVDALLGKRGNSGSHKEDDKVAETIMKNLQEINNRGMNEYTFFATNFPDALDKAAIRSGRVDMKVKFDLPDYDSRKMLFDGYIDMINQRANYKVIRNFNSDTLAEMTDGYSNSDIEGVLDRALHNKIRAEMRVRPTGIIPAYWIGQNKLEYAINEFKIEAKKTEKKPIGFMRD